MHKPEEVEMPLTLIYIGKYAFRNCISLLEANIPEGSQRIENCAFENCQSMKRLKIPASTESIGDSAFIGCTALDTVYAYMDTLCLTGKDVFKGGIMEMPVPEGIRPILVRDSQKEEIFSIDGRRLAKPQKGLNIIRYQDGTTKKVLR